jgi:hypothetical protein
MKHCLEKKKHNHIKELCTRMSENLNHMVKPQKCYDPNHT